MNTKKDSVIEYSRVVNQMRPSRGLLFGILILAALLAFEIFNYSTTDFALTDLMGSLRFADIRWATILALAFCGIDFAGIARLFTPEKGIGEPKEVWYLFAAWLLAATMNAMLTYWGVAVAILNHSSMGVAVISQDTLVRVVPVFVAIMVWVIRVLIIGSFSVAGNRLFSQSESPRPMRHSPGMVQPQFSASSHEIPAQPTPFKPAPKVEQTAAHSGSPRSEPTYHPASMSGPNNHSPQIRK